MNDFNAFIDDVPLWSASFGLALLDCIRARRNITVLDIGCGEGFPIIEIAARFGKTGLYLGIDPLMKPLQRMALKKELYELPTALAVQAVAEWLPFKANHFDLIVSNNGINNVTDVRQTLKECRRIIRPSGQMVFTVNSDQTMKEFYDVFVRALAASTHQAEEKISTHIRSKRKSEQEWRLLLEDSGFKVKTVKTGQFKMFFLDGPSMMEHYLIRHFFLPGWKSLVEPENRSAVFQEIETELNRTSDVKGKVSLTIPYFVFDCRAE